jgi:quinol monooxygenase YgiN
VLIRIVRLTFRPDAVDAFLEIFDASAAKIRAFPGCTHLALWQDETTPYILTTYSHWTDAGALDTYRGSALFKQTWARTKKLFADAPLAYSHFVLRPDAAENDMGFRVRGLE